MDTPGSPEESIRLAEHYRRLTDEELIAIVRQKDELTEQAQQALAGEMQSRRLTAPVEEKQTPRPARAPDAAEEDDPYADERELVEIRKVWSRDDALQLQRVLDVAGIPFYMGDENATGVDDVRSNFVEGVAVKVMQVGEQWARGALENYSPKDERPEPEEQDAGEVAIRCPKCLSTEVVFDELVGEKAGGESAEASAGDEPKYRWTCDSCGYEWEDDGVERKG